MKDNEVKVMAMNFYKGYGLGKDLIKDRILNWIFDADEAQIDRVLADMDIPESTDDVFDKFLEQKNHLVTLDEQMNSVFNDMDNYRKTHIDSRYTSKEQTITSKQTV